MAARTGCYHGPLNSDHPRGSVMQKPSPWSRAYFSEALAPAEFTPSMCLLWRWLGGDASMWCEAVHRVCWLWGLPGGTDQGQLLPVFCPGPPSMSYKVVCRWLLLVLGLNVPRQGQTPSQGQLLLALDPGSLSERSGALRGQMLLVCEILGKLEA